MTRPVDNATVIFENRHTTDDARVRFMDNGWLAVQSETEWTYYPPHEIDRVETGGGE